ncbi:MAG: hypothetical protein QM767_12070 [Anaeromyxobacter sp.]
MEPTSVRPVNSPRATPSRLLTSASKLRREPRPDSRSMKAMPSELRPPIASRCRPRSV